MKSALKALATEFSAVHCSCACHSINLLARRVLYEEGPVAEGNVLMRKVRAAAPSCPAEVDTRFVSAYNGYEWAVKNRANLISEGVLSHEEFAKVAAAEELLAPFNFASRALEKDTATVFDIVCQCGKLFPTLDPAKNRIVHEILERDFFCDALVAAAALHPMIVPSNLAPPMLRMIETCLTNLFGHVTNGLPRQIRTEVARILDGASQPAAVRKPNPTYNDAWGTGDTPLTCELCALPMVLPASSASVERSFAVLGRAVNPQRTSISQQSLKSQVVAHSMLTKQIHKCTLATTIPLVSEALAVLDSMFPCFVASEAARLKAGDTVAVWLNVKQNGKNLEKFKAKLLQSEGDEWRVRWHGNPSSGQTFAPLVDIWEVDS